MNTAAASHRPVPAWPAALRRALWWLWAVFWLLMISVAVQDHWADDQVRWWQPLAWEGSSALVATGMMLLLVRYGTRQQHLLAQPWRWFWLHLKWLPLGSTLFIVITYGSRHLLYAALGERYSHDPWWQLWPYETIKLGLFASLWLGVIFGIHAFLAWRDQQLRLQQVQRALTEARLQQLQAQLQPHFLFNTLNTISAFIHSDPDRADRLLNQLAELLRASLSHGEQQLVALAEELHLLRLYADIMTERFAPRVQLDWHIADETLALTVPSLLLQPLLENAFKHGVEPSAEITRITVSAQCVNAQLVLTVANSRHGGAGASQRGNGLGLRNCRERLQAIYADTAALRVQAEPSQMVVQVCLPMVVPDLAPNLAPSLAPSPTPSTTRNAL